MRGFLILCLVGVAVGGRLGYDYRPNGPGSLSSGIGSNNGIGSGIGSVFSRPLSSGGLGSSIGGGIGVDEGSRGSFSGQFGSGSIGGGIPLSNAPVVTEYNKEYFFHSAPEDDIVDGDASQRITSSLKKNLRVVFIKAPENNGITKAALQIAKQASEDKTAIYVLTKQNDVSDLTQQLQELSQVRSQKPEVRFIKYRTAQDALNAQRAIQAQYDALGGSSRSSNEGIAPVLNYASSSPVGSIQGSASETSSLSNSNLSGATSLSSGSYIAPKKSYLPPVVF